MNVPEVVDRLLATLRERGETLALAEADTGGLALAWLTSRPGSSAVVRGGVVPYHDDLKRGLLGVDDALLRTYGAVSREAAAAMAIGARSACGASYGLATTGIAGPGGATPTKPVGLAWIAVADASGVMVREHHWSGDRDANRERSAVALLELAETIVTSRAPAASSHRSTPN